MLTIDLKEPAATRLKPLFAVAEKDILEVIKDARGHMPHALLRFARPASAVMRVWSDYGYGDEIDAIAKATGVQRPLVELLQYSYELSHVGSVLMGQAAAPIGCTVGIRDGVHLRTLDWDLPAVGNTSRIVKYQCRDQHVFYGVTIPGYVGMLTGMVPGAYSASINYATPDKIPKRATGPAFLLRHVLETVTSFERALTVLMEAPVATPVFFALCGTEKDQACIIERTPKHAQCRWQRSGGQPLVHANHYVAMKRTTEPDLYESSKERFGFMREALSHSGSLARYGRLLRKVPLTNDTTQQRVVMCAKKGYITLS